MLALLLSHPPILYIRILITYVTLTLIEYIWPITFSLHRCHSHFKQSLREPICTSFALVNLSIFFIGLNNIIQKISKDNKNKKTMFLRLVMLIYHAWGLIWHL
jgi:hypothetical protein